VRAEARRTRGKTRKRRSRAPVPAAPFVGRERELAELGAALDRAKAGSGSITMIVGGPGAGKTRTAMEFAERAATAGTFVTVGRCYEGDGIPLHYPWMMCLRRYVEEYGTPALAKVVGVHAANLAWFAAGPRSAGPAARGTSDDDLEGLPFRFFDFMTAFLRRMCAERPAVVILDNLHWADPSSLAFLEFLVPDIHEIPLLILGTYRDTDIRRGHRLVATLGALAREPVYRRIHLPGLEGPEIARLFQETLGRAPSPSLVAAILERTEGNPFFVTEVLRLLAERPPGEKDTTFALPEGIRHAIGQRLERLPAEVTEILRTAAVVGRTFELQVLRGLISGSDEDCLLERLERAAEAHLIAEVPDSVGRWRFSHVMIQETLLEEMTMARRARLHADIVNVLEKLSAEAPGRYTGELFVHCTAAFTVLGAEALVRHAVEAAREALALQAFENALAFVDSAIEAKRQREGDAAGMDRELAELAYWRSIALFRLRRSEEARAELRSSFEWFRRNGDPGRAVDILVRHHFREEMDPAFCPDLVTQALELAEPGSLDEARLLCVYAGFAAKSADEARSMLRKARASAERHGDQLLAAWTAASLARVGYLTEDAETTDRASREAVALSDSVGATGPALRALWCLARFYLRCGRAEEAARVLQSMAERVRPDRTSLYSDGNYYAVLATLQLYRGEFAACRETCRAGLDRGIHVSGLADRLLVVDMHTGRLDRTSSAWRRLEASGEMNPIRMITLEALLSGRVLSTEKAARDLRALSASPSTGVIGGRVGLVYPLALIACVQGDVKAAAELYPTVLCHAGLMPGWVGAVSSDRLLGLLCACTGDLDKAVKHFEDSIAFCERAGYRVELAWAFHDRADALLRRGRPGDERSAGKLLERGLAIAVELGMKPLAGKISDRLQQMHEDAAERFPDGLTKREVEILRLISRGLTNQEIGDRLFISQHTAATHVQHILEKTGMANRAELTAYAMRAGLVE
jgi:DNA-binding CsgD family transcriptional regulator